MDRDGWAFYNSARQIVRHLRNDFDFVIECAESKPKLSAKAYDLIYVFFWGESFHNQFGFDPDRTIKEVSSHRWQDDPRFGPCSPNEMVKRYLGDARTVICTSERLVNTITPHHPRVFHTPNGIDPLVFKKLRDRTGPLLIGWAGNIKDPVKGVDEILKPACEGRFRLVLAPGSLSHESMNEFYNQIDVLAITSRHEGEPLTLLEGMAAGCFPVCADVGIVPELVKSGENGIILTERTTEALSSAFGWCEMNLDQVREAADINSALIWQ